MRRLKRRLSQAFEWFMGLPVWILLLIFWLMGTGLIILCTLALYLLWSLLA